MQLKGLRAIKRSLVAVAGPPFTSQGHRFPLWLSLPPYGALSNCPIV